MDQRGLDPARATPGRGVVRMIGESLVEAMELARQKDSAKGDERNALGAAYGQVEEQEDEHLFTPAAGAASCGSTEAMKVGPSRSPARSRACAT